MATTPLFIVGIQRSGTSLLRELLRNHPEVSLSHAETDMLPSLAKKLRRAPPPQTWAEFEQLADWARRFPYFHHLDSRGISFTNRDWFDTCTSMDAAGIFEAMVRLDAGTTSEESRVWGDKSPRYRVDLPLIASLFPSMRVLHIIRDVRGVCLSARNAWGAHPLRTAQTWAADIETCREDSTLLNAEQYLEIRYEDLLDDPSRELSRACSLVGVDFRESMLDLDSPVDRLGNTAGTHRVVTENQARWKQELHAHTRSKIERIAGTVMDACGYSLEFGEPQRIPPSSTLSGALRLHDGIRLLSHRGQRWGFINALQRTAHATLQ